MMAAFTRVVPWVAAAILLALIPGYAAGQSADAQTKKITIKTTDTGFDPNRIEVPQGSLVEITFVWSHNAYPLEEHIIIFKDFKVESEKIDAQHREATVKLVATDSGTFNFKCDLECDLHDFMQAGELVVTPGGGAAAALTLTKLEIPAGGVSVRGDAVAIMASLQDEKGNAVPKAQLRFFLEPTFAGAKSLMEIVTAETDESGLARVAAYRPTHKEGEKLVVKFEGAGVYAATEAVVEIPPSSDFGPTLEEEPRYLERLRGDAPAVFAAVILGIWGTFAFILSRVWAASRVKEEGV